jgi:hypothetical protein
LNPEIGGYAGYRPWEGLIAEVIIHNGRVKEIGFLPLDLDEGEAYREEYEDLEFLSRRGLAELARGPLADSILLRLHDLSAAYGAELSTTESGAVLRIGPEG